MGRRSTRKRRRSTAVNSRRKNSDDTKYATGWEQIYGNKTTNSAGNSRASSTATDQNIRPETDTADSPGRLPCP